jgi:thiamine biosynthesis lipoprotein
VGPLTRLWREARTAGSPPSAAAVAEALGRVGLSNVEFDRARSRVRFRRAEVELDFGGIGKGLAADEALRAIEGAGLARALVAIGGDIAVGEPPPDRAGWPIGIGDPERGESIEEVEIVRAGISTSGDAEQHLVVDGVRLSHIIDPARGAPLADQPQFTVLAPSAGSADAWATALAVRPELATALRTREGFRVWIRRASAPAPTEK